MKTLAGIEVEANIKNKVAPQLDANSSVVADHTIESASHATRSQGGHSLARRSLSTETGNEVDVHNNTTQLVKRQEGDIKVILHTLETLQKEVTSFQKELKSVKGAVNDIRVRQEEQQSPELFEDIELLTETVANVSNKVGELDALKLESKMMQSRVKRLEDEKRGHQTGMEPPATPKLSSSNARSAQSLQKAEEKGLGINAHSPRRSAHPAVVDDALSRSRAASVQGSSTPRDHHRNDMPPPELPRSMSSRASAKPSFRSLRS